MKRLFYVLAFSLVFSCNSSAQKNDTTSEKEFAVTKTEAEWKKELTSEQFYVLRKAGTERPFSSPLNKENRKGTLRMASFFGCKEGDLSLLGLCFGASLRQRCQNCKDPEYERSVAILRAPATSYVERLLSVCAAK